MDLESASQNLAHYFILRDVTRAACVHCLVVRMYLAASLALLLVVSKGDDTSTQLRDEVVHYCIFVIWLLNQEQHNITACDVGITFSQKSLSV